MLVCLACPKQAHLHDDHNHAALTVKSGGTALNGPSKENIKSFTAQLKDIVMKFSSGAYRHCRPCTAAAVRGGVADDDNKILYGYDDEKRSILVGSNFEEQGMSDHMLHNTNNGTLHEEDGSSAGASHRFGDSSSSSSRYELLPMARRKRHKKKSASNTSELASSSKSTLAMKQLPCNPDECDTIDAIEQLLNAHFQREERILEEERACLSRDNDEQLEGVESAARADHQLLEDAQLVSREYQMAGGEGDVDGHVSRSGGKRHAKVQEEAVGKFEEWVAQVEPGVMITFVALHDGSNHLRRIRFSREMFSKWQAQQWWAENSEMVRELYSVSQSEAPFKSCTSARSSSMSSSSSSLRQNVLRNTPELQSRVESCQNSPSETPAIIHTLDNRMFSPTQASTSSISNRSMFGSHSHELVDHHDNPLYDSPEFELCYHDSVNGSFLFQRKLWVDEHSQRLQLPKDDTMDDDDPNALTGGIVREAKRVRFIRQVSQISNS